MKTSRSTKVKQLLFIHFDWCKFRRCFYAYSREIAAAQINDFEFYLNAAIFAYSFVRLSATLTIALYGDRFGLLQFDYVAAFLRRHAPLIANIIPICMWPYEILLFFALHSLQSLPPIATFVSIAKQLIVDAQDSYELCRFSAPKIAQIRQNGAEKWFEFRGHHPPPAIIPLAQKFNIDLLLLRLRFADVDRRKFLRKIRSNCRKPLFPHLSARLRLRTILLMLFGDFVSFIIQIGAVIVITIFLLICIAFSALPSITLGISLWIGVEARLIYYFGFQATHYCVLFSYFIILISITIVQHIGSQRGTLRHTFRIAQKRNYLLPTFPFLFPSSSSFVTPPPSSSFLTSNLNNQYLQQPQQQQQQQQQQKQRQQRRKQQRQQQKRQRKSLRFLAEYHHVAMIVDRLDREILGRMLAAFIVCNIPVNFIATRQLILFSTRNSLFEWFVILVAYGILFLGSLISLIPLSVVVRSMRRHVPMIGTIQNGLHGRAAIRCKLKWDQHYDHLANGPRVAVHVHPWGAIEFGSILRVSSGWNLFKNKSKNQIFFCLLVHVFSLFVFVGLIFFSYFYRCS